MKFISLFAGVGGFDLALERLGHQCVYANDFDKYCKITYEKNFRRTLDTRSLTEVAAEEIPEHELLVGGFPCQSFSVAGKRKGFDDVRGTLFFDICRILKEKRSRLLLLENVKGLLSHDGGHTFKTIISTLTELGYNLQWQVLNSKNFGVPQNRERIFIVGHLRGTPRPEVFPIFTEDIGNNGEIISTAIDSNYFKGPDNHGQRTMILTQQPVFKKGFPREVTIKEVDEVPTIKQSISKRGDSDPLIGTLRTHKDGQGFREMKSGLAPTIPARAREDGSGQPVVAVCGIDRKNKSQNGRLSKEPGEPMFTLTQQDRHGVSDGISIRRLTPLECERLQGFPDNWTAGISDTQRYKQMGNAVTVNVVYEIAKRLM